MICISRADHMLHIQVRKKYLFSLCSFVKHMLYNNDWQVSTSYFICLTQHPNFFMFIAKMSFKKIFQIIFNRQQFKMYLEAVSGLACVQKG